MENMQDTYLDYQSVKPVDERVFEQMKVFFNQHFVKVLEILGSHSKNMI